MSEIIIKPNGKLNGNIKISGSKNASLPIMAACLLNSGKTRLFNVPDLSDINTMCILLEETGAIVLHEKNHIEINSENISNHCSDYNLANKLRGSFLISGPLLARLGKVKIPLPGGCPIGTRPIDLHLKGFSLLGADISQCHGYVELKAKRLKGKKIYLDFPSVGATENIMMAASLAHGTTIIENAATEPEISDLADFLNKQGAKITGAGSDTVMIDGVDSLTSVSHTVIPDRIEAGTFLLAFAITGGTGKISNINCEHIKPVAAKLMEMGIKLKCHDDFIDIDATKPLHTADIKTLPFPGFPTDMQAPFSALMSISKGTGIVTETVFENRFLHMNELNRMGAKIKIDGRTSVIEGVKNLTGAHVNAMDLRGGAALVLAGLVANGETRITGVEHIKRGYENLTGKLRSLGADIEVFHQKGQ